MDRRLFILIINCLLATSVLADETTGSGTGASAYSDPDFSLEVDLTLQCEHCDSMQLYLPRPLTLVQMMDIVSEFPRSNWESGHVAIDDLVTMRDFDHSTLREMMCRPNRPYTRVPRRAPGLAERALMGVAEQSLGDTIGGTVAGNPTIMLGYKYIPEGGSAVDKVGDFLTPNLSILTNEEMALRAATTSEQQLALYHTAPAQEHLGGINAVTIANVRGGMAITEMRFGNITLTKNATEDVFHGTHRDGRSFTVYCPAVSRRQEP